MTDDNLRELGHELSWDRPDASRRETVRAQLLLAAEDAPPRRSHRGLAIAGAAFAGGVVAAAAIALVVVRADRSPPPASRARITASSTAELEHSVVPTPAGSDEVVRVHAGNVRIAAPAAPSTDRVRVQTRDAAVEGVGEYEVAVVRDRLTSVTVRSGTAHVTVVGHMQPIFLSTGETWRATAITADIMAPSTGSAAANAEPPIANVEPPIANVGPSVANVEPPVANVEPPVANVEAAAPVAKAESSEQRRSVLHADAAAPSRRTDPAPAQPGPQSVSPPDPLPALASTERATPPLPASRTPSPTERHFQAGWALLRAGKPREAAIELGLAADAGDRDPLAADARYFQAIALIRAGAARDAEAALVAFLDRAPASLRRGRAAVMLARLIAARGDVKSARAWFESALHDPDPEVAAAARAGLDATPR